MVRKLYGLTLSDNAFRAELVLRELGVEFELVSVDLWKQEQHSDWYKKINPRGQIPAFDDDGVILAESVAIAQYAQAMYGTGANSLMPSEKAELGLYYTLIAQWHEKLSPKTIIGSVVFGGGTKESLAPRIQALKKELKVWEALLEGKEYFLGRKLTLIDCIVIPMIFNLFNVLGLAPTEYPNLHGWMERMLARPCVRDCAFTGPEGTATKFAPMTKGVKFLE